MALRPWTAQSVAGGSSGTRADSAQQPSLASSVAEEEQIHFAAQFGVTVVKAPSKPATFGSSLHL